MYRKFYLILSLISAAVLLAFIGVATYEEFSPEWKHYQTAYKDLFIKNATDEASKKRAESLDLRIQQIYLTSLKKDDRCMSCHSGVNNPLMANEKPPFKAHSGVYLKNHPVEKYGCTICHYGQGRALTVKNAHGYEAHWLEPRLKGIFAQALCGKCHFMDQRLPLEAALPGGKAYAKGWATYMDNNCLGCHQFKNGLYGRPDRIGPVLTPVGKKVNPAWLKKWIKNPKDYLPKTKMPNFLLEDDDVNLIAPYLLSLAKGAKINEPKADKKLKNSSAVEAGKQRVDQLGCLGCHTIKKTGQDFAPDLSEISSKTHPPWLFFWIKDPKVYQPDTKMPNLRIPEEDLQEIVAYLSTLKKDSGPGDAATVTSPTAEKTALEAGEALVKDKGCTGCHEIAKFPLGYNAPEHDGIGSKWPAQLIWSKIPGVDHTLLNWLKIKVKEPRKFATDTIVTRMPTFSFTDSDADALVTFLLSLTKEMVPPSYVRVLADPTTIVMRGKRFLEDHNCLGCHQIDKQGGDIGPDLTFEGKRVNPVWLVDFLQTPFKIRPQNILPTRMPTFGLTIDQAATVSSYFADRNKAVDPDDKIEEKIADKKERDKAWRLYRQFFACHACHSWQGTGGTIGPDQSDLGNRLQQQWTADWLKNPHQFIPDARMPNFEFYADELALLTDLLLDFKDISQSVRDQMRRNWQDELLEQTAAQPAPQSISTQDQGGN